MKTKKISALILAIAMIACIFIMPANAAETETAAHEHFEIIIENEDISEETRRKIMVHFANHCEEDDCATTYGLTCTLLGHKTETTRVYKITHKVRSTSPRCLKKTYTYEACTRCDYENSTLMASEYIACC